MAKEYMSKDEFAEQILQRREVDVFLSMWDVVADGDFDRSPTVRSARDMFEGKRPPSLELMSCRICYKGKKSQQLPYFELEMGNVEEKSIEVHLYVGEPVNKWRSEMQVVTLPGCDTKKIRFPLPLDGTTWNESGLKFTVLIVVDALRVIEFTARVND